MGNQASSNRVDDHGRKRAQIGQLSLPPNMLHDAPSNSKNQKQNIINNRCSLDVELVQDSAYGSPNMSPKEYAHHTRQLVYPNRYANPKNLEIQVLASTWYRDSHGLYDYEESQKLTINQFRLNQNFFFKRENDNIVHSTFRSLQEMREDQALLAEQQREDYKKIVAACLFKDNGFWLYHRETVDDAEDEKTNPGDKLWLVMRLMGRDKNHGFKPDQGYKLNIGDTVKFGRVRYKVVMLQNPTDGFQEFSLLDRFQRQHFIHQQIKEGYIQKSDRKVSRNNSRRRSSSAGPGTASRNSSLQNSPSPRMAGNGGQSSMGNSENIPRFQSQITQFDQFQQEHGGSFYGYDEDEESDSRDGDGIDSFVESRSDSQQQLSSGEDETESDQLDSRRDPVIDEIEELATQQQIDFRASQNNQSLASGMTPAAREKSRSLIPNFGVGRFNSVVPTDALAQNNVQSNDLERHGSRQQSMVQPNDQMLNIPADTTPQRTRARRLSGFENLEESQSHSGINGREQNPLLHQTGTFLFGQSGVQSNIGMSQVSGVTGAREHIELGDSQSLALAANLNLEATQAGLFDNADDREYQRKLKKRLRKNQKQKQKLKQKLKEQQAKFIEGKVCRICLGEENEKSDPLISPCKCAGTMSHIHLECLREWLNSKRSRKESPYVKTYCWKALECELCKVRFPGQVFPDGTIVNDKLRLTQKQIKKLGKPIEILDFDRPDTDFIVLESVTLQNIRIIHVITMNEKQFIKVGRGHETDIRVTDISVSRFHARINRSLTTGEYFVEDNKSKFGTLVQVRRPILLEKNKNNYLQMGRTMLQIRIEDKDLIHETYKNDTSTMCKALLCCKKRQKITEFLTEPQIEFYPSEWNPPEPVDLDETSPKIGETQGIEQTRDEDQPSAAGHLNNSGELRPDGHAREESPIMQLSPAPNQSIEDAVEAPLIGQARSLTNPEEESKQMTDANNQFTTTNQFPSSVLYQTGQESALKATGIAPNNPLLRPVNSSDVYDPEVQGREQLDGRAGAQDNLDGQGGPIQENEAQSLNNGGNIMEERRDVNGIQDNQASNGDPLQQNEENNNDNSAMHDNSGMNQRTDIKVVNDEQLAQQIANSGDQHEVSSQIEGSPNIHFAGMPTGLNNKNSFKIQDINTTPQYHDQRDFQDQHQALNNDIQQERSDNQQDGDNGVPR